MVYLSFSHLIWVGITLLKHYYSTATRAAVLAVAASATATPSAELILAQHAVFTHGSRTVGPDLLGLSSEMLHGSLVALIRSLSHNIGVRTHLGVTVSVLLMSPRETLVTKTITHSVLVFEIVLMLNCRLCHLV